MVSLQWCIHIKVIDMSLSSVYNRAVSFVFKKTSRYLPPRLFFHMQYRVAMGKAAHLRHPRTFNEKIMKLILTERDPILSVLVDKYRVKKYVADRIGEEYVVPTIGLWDSADEIDFNSLPEQFILKCNHDSGSAVICMDKSSFDCEEARRSLAESLATAYSSNREWAYKDVPRKILAEPLLNPDGAHLDDYRFFCCDGEPKFVYVSTAGHINFLSLDWKFLPFSRKDFPPQETLPDKPSRYDDMLRVARILSEGLKFVRVDLYQVGEQVLFGELTLYPSGGVMYLSSYDQDVALGELLDIQF